MLMAATLQSLLPIILLLTKSVVKLKVTRRELLMPFVQLSMILNQSMITMYMACQ